MKIYGYVIVVLVLSTVAVTAGYAESGKAGGQSGGGAPSPSGKAGGQQPGGGKSTSSVNGTGMGPRH